MVQIRIGESKSSFGGDVDNFRCNYHWQNNIANSGAHVSLFINEGKHKGPTFPLVKAGSGLNKVKKVLLILIAPICLFCMLLLPNFQCSHLPQEYLFVCDSSEKAYHPQNLIWCNRGHKMGISEVFIWSFYWTLKCCVVKQQEQVNIHHIRRVHFSSEVLPSAGHAVHLCNQVASEFPSPI